MHILFVDESGTAPNPNSKTKYFTLGGVIIPENAWFLTRNRLSIIRNKYNITGEIKWRYFSPHNTDSSNSVAHLSEEDRNAAREAILSILSSTKSIKTIAVITSVVAAYQLYEIVNADDLYHSTYKPMTERFQYHLQETAENGIIVCDHRGPKDDERLRGVHQKLMSGKGQNCSNYKNLIEGVFMSPSHYGVGIQLADMFAGAVARKFTANDDSFFKIVEDSLRKSPHGVIEGYGLVKYPKVNWI